MKHTRVFRRLLAAALTVATLTTVGSAMAGTPIDQPLPGYASIIDPVRELTAGLTSTVTVKVHHIGPLPIDWVAIAPSNSASLNSAMGYSGWAPQSVTGNRAIFAGRQIYPASTWHFELQLSGVSPTGAVPAGDITVPLTVETSSDGGAHKRLFTAPPNDPGALSLIVRVLRITTAPGIASPAKAADGTVTAGQDNLKVGSTIKNFGSGTLTPTAVLSADNATIPAASVPVTLGPGEATTLSYDAVAGKTGTLTFGLNVTSVSPAATAVAGSAVSAVETAPAIACRTTTAGGADSIFNPAYSVVFDKTGLPSLDVESYTLTVKTTPAFGPAPVTLGTIAGGDLAAQKLDFPPVAVPATVQENSYDVVLDIAAVDSNGADLAASSIACPAVRVDIQAPSFVSATMTEIDSALRQVKLAPDAAIRLTFSEVIASGADSAEDWVPLDASGNRVSGATVQGVEPCSDAATTCRTITVDAGFTDAWRSIASIRYCGGEMTSYADLVGNHAACGSAIAVS